MKINFYTCYLILLSLLCVNMSNGSNTLKHEKDIGNHVPSGKDCPPKDALQKEIEAYRFVRKPVTDGDFKTYVNEGRLARRTNQTPEMICSCCGLSFFDTQTAAIDKYNKVIKPHAIRSEFTSTHLAKGKILKTDGVCTKTKKGHFTLHEFTGIDLTTGFTIVCQL